MANTPSRPSSLKRHAAHLLLLLATLTAVPAGDLQAFEVADPFATHALTPPRPALSLDAPRMVADLLQEGFAESGRLSTRIPAAGREDDSLDALFEFNLRYPKQIPHRPPRNEPKILRIIE